VQASLLVIQKQNSSGVGILCGGGKLRHKKKSARLSADLLDTNLDIDSSGYQVPDDKDILQFE
jgi:hypothetical protein